MRARHIPRPDGRSYCGRSVRWPRSDAAKVRRAYDDKRNREGACVPCRARLEAEERGVQQDLDDASLEELETAARVLDSAQLERQEKLARDREEHARSRARRDAAKLHRFEKGAR